MTPRCEAQVRRHAEINPEEPGYTVTGPCGRRVKASVKVGSRDVAVCSAHLHKLAMAEGLACPPDYYEPSDYPGSGR